MRPAYLVTFFGGLLIAALFFSPSPAQDKGGRAGNAPPVWEYRVLAVLDLVELEDTINDPKKATAAIETKFNELGRDGWEIADPLPGTVVFKRLKR